MVVGRTATKGPKAAEMGISVAVMRAAVVIQMTWVGAPTVYYGDEAGVCGWTDPDNRRTYPWGNENIDLLRFHYEAIKIHKAYDVLKTGSIKALYGTHGVVCYGRFDKNDQFVILVNNNNYDVSVEIPVWQIGIENSSRMVRMLYTNSETYGVDMAVYYVENGMLNMRLWSKSAVVVKNYPKSLA
jgi:alpha-glucosidase